MLYNEQWSCNGMSGKQWYDYCDLLCSAAYHYSLSKKRRYTAEERQKERAKAENNLRQAEAIDPNHYHLYFGRGTSKSIGSLAIYYKNEEGEVFEAYGGGLYNY